jgi:hypothetical protein
MVDVSRGRIRSRDDQGQMLMRRWFYLLFLCLMAACSNNGTVVPNVSPPTAVSTLQPNFVVPSDTPPLVTPTPRLTATPVCPAAPPTRLILNQRGRVLPDDPRPINMRAEPGTGSAMITSITIMEVFYVLEGPVCDGEYAWYKVQYQDDEGWIAEGDFSSYYVEPYLPD